MNDPLPEFSVCRHKAVQASVLTYSVSGFDARTGSIGSGPGWTAEAVFVRELNRVECIVDGKPDLEVLLQSMRSFTQDGWSVWAVVPQAELGGAHREFREHAERLQGWWVAGDRIAFSTPELP